MVARSSRQRRKLANGYFEGDAKPAPPPPHRPRARDSPSFLPSFLMADYDDDKDYCPLCMEELDLTDQTFNACPCGYQVCLWCWHQIKNEYNGLCPACRQPYADLAKHKHPLDREEVVRRTKQRKQKEKQDRRALSAAGHSKAAAATPTPAPAPTLPRKSLQNVRVLQRNLVYVIGLPVHFANETMLRAHDCFGQYGTIVKAVVNKAHLSADRATHASTASAYITFAQKEHALACIVAIDGYCLDGSVLRASFGTTKYCNFFLRKMQCNNPDCLYLHELGDEDDSFTKEEMQTALHSGKAAFRDISTVSGQMEERAGSRFPPPTRPPPSSSTSSSRSASSLARATTLVRSQSSEVYGNSQRHAQSAAAISKLRQASGDLDPRNSSTENTRAATHNLYSKVVARGSSSSYGNATIESASESTSTPLLRVETSRGKETTQSVDAVVSPLEALKLATGSSTEKPVWAQPFPTPTVLHHEPDEPMTTTTSSSSSETSVYSPFGLGFDAGASSGNVELLPTPAVASDGWDASSLSDPTLSAFSPAVSTIPSASTSSSMSFASIDAIFSQRNESTEALAGLLGLQLAPESIAKIPPPQDGHTSRFAFANPTDARPDRPPTQTRFELLDGTKLNDRSFSALDAARYDPASSVSSGLALVTDRCDFPPLGSAPKDVHPPLPLSSPSFGSALHRAEGPLDGAVGTDAGGGGLAFLQQMLPNVNISFGGDYSRSLSSRGGFHGTSATPASERRSGRRLFERCERRTDGMKACESWDGGTRSSCVFDEGPSSARAFSSCSDPALVTRGLSTDLYDLTSSTSIASHESESESVRLHEDLGTFR
ncbi:hypothetical protein PsorP6_005629 [Peronosclerospora sorghi]|uniref:Uncharacterized protein n=1 Tax=Peronosclerospora sorghi TaxID=230839 RepID=A0ACC0W1W4_9STRA|nr:hypothetical protein PsorP6_005629 [Peronosclerospora sorghi]